MMDKIKIARELLKLSKELVGSRLQTREELEEDIYDYQRERDYLARRVNKDMMNIGVKFLSVIKLLRKAGDSKSADLAEKWVVRFLKNYN